jgi:hypothetical protein
MGIERKRLAAVFYLPSSTTSCDLPMMAGAAGATACHFKSEVNDLLYCKWANLQVEIRCIGSAS